MKIKSIDTWGDHYPLKTRGIQETIKHFSEVNNLSYTKELELFAFDLLCEFKHNQSIEGGNHE